MRTLGKLAQYRRRARINDGRNDFTLADWRALVARSPQCHWCGRKWTKKRRPTHDHVIAISKGGENTLENSCCACLECNTRKGAHPINPHTGQCILV
jgi:hypothetical protein